MKKKLCGEGVVNITSTSIKVQDIDVLNSYVMVFHDMRDVLITPFEVIIFECYFNIKTKRRISNRKSNFFSLMYNQWSVKTQKQMIQKSYLKYKNFYFPLLGTIICLFFYSHDLRYV